MTDHAIPDELGRFLESWLDWIERGAPDGRPYTREESLCTAAVWYAAGPTLRDCLWDQLSYAFRADGLDANYPFGEREYYNAKDRRTMHRSLKRRAWVREKVAQYRAQSSPK